MGPRSHVHGIFTELVSTNISWRLACEHVPFDARYIRVTQMA